MSNIDHIIDPRIDPIIDVIIDQISYSTIEIIDQKYIDIIQNDSDIIQNDSDIIQNDSDMNIDIEEIPYIINTYPDNIIIAEIIEKAEINNDNEKSSYIGELWLKKKINNIMDKISNLPLYKKIPAKLMVLLGENIAKLLLVTSTIIFSLIFIALMQIYQILFLLFFIFIGPSLYYFFPTIYYRIKEFYISKNI